MKYLLHLAPLITTTCCFAQGTFHYDQQSSTYEVPDGYNVGPAIESLLPYTGQSFTPQLPGIDFIRLKLNDGDIVDGVGATIYLNLRSDSITGTILGSTDPVTMPNGFTGTANFFFPNTVTLSPGTTYYFQLVLQAAINWHVDAEGFNYLGGEGFAHGQPYPGTDYWFREGLYTVPEPSPILLGLAGVLAIGLARGTCKSVFHKSP